MARGNKKGQAGMQTSSKKPLYKLVGAVFAAFIAFSVVQHLLVNLCVCVPPLMRYARPWCTCCRVQTCMQLLAMGGNTKGFWAGKREATTRLAVLVAVAQVAIGTDT